MIAKYPGTCICKSPVKIGEIIAYDHVTRRVVSCPRCDGADRVSFDKAAIKCGDLSAFVARKDGVVRAVKFTDGLDSSIYVLRSEGWDWRSGMMASRELAAMVAATANAAPRSSSPPMPPQSSRASSAPTWPPSWPSVLRLRTIRSST